MYVATPCGAYHGGINLGACVNEALNTTSQAWSRTPQRGTHCCCVSHVVNLVPDYIGKNGVTQAQTARRMYRDTVQSCRVPKYCSSGLH